MGIWFLLQVEGKHNNFRCFYLSENLDVNDDYTFWIHKDDHEPVSEQLTALSGAHQFTWSKLKFHFHENELALMLSKSGICVGFFTDNAT